MPDSTKSDVDRRRFLRGAVTGAAALAAQATAAEAQQPVAPAAEKAIETSPSQASAATERPGSDFMVDVIKTLDMEYCAANPGTSFRGLHESVDQLWRQYRPGIAHLPSTKNPP